MKASVVEVVGWWGVVERGEDDLRCGGDDSLVSLGIW